ncbi:hypothetical protein BGZ59_004670 [Podila verticillata]|nr:hypothetical protein BGZ59_004670 [Podila verticillata]KFH69249.1 hypothetical protein MVEG_04064 [Podila verticillata NRRL 6337]
MSSPQNQLTLTNPKQNDVYHVGKEVHVRATLQGGINSELWKKNPNVKFTLRKNLAHPAGGNALGSANIRDLIHNGFNFMVLKKYLVTSKRTSYYVLASWEDQGSVQSTESGVFNLEM